MYRYTFNVSEYDPDRETYTYRWNGEFRQSDKETALDRAGVIQEALPAGFKVDVLEVETTIHTVLD